ncbi:hypothetical protein Fot_21973 [Forsythia ovata]|uniref:Uncharacterized protein n=1 Tax=Forsythia ovata TaxID=205694 RepID=A0ABD1UWP2_9LAMI
MAKYAFSNIPVFSIDEDGDDNGNVTLPPLSSILCLSVTAFLAPKSDINVSPHLPPPSYKPPISSHNVRQQSLHSPPKNFMNIFERTVAKIDMSEVGFLEKRFNSFKK